MYKLSVYQVCIGPSTGWGTLGGDFEAYELLGSMRIRLANAKSMVEVMERAEVKINEDAFKAVENLMHFKTKYLGL
jgi:hypothetical protein